MGNRYPASVLDVTAQELADIKQRDPGARYRVGGLVRGDIAGLAANISAICESYERNSRNNARVNAVTPSAAMAWGGTPAAGTLGYVNTGVSTAGYTYTQLAPTGSIVNGAPSNNRAKIGLPFRLYGAFPHSVAADGVQAASAYGRNGVRMSSPTARHTFVTDEPKPILEMGGNSAKYIINYNDGSGWKRIFDSSLLAGGEVTRWSVVHTASGGYNALFLDFSQLGGRMRRIIEVQQVGDSTIKRVGITATSTYFEPPESLRVIHITDSLGDTSPDASMGECYVANLQDFFGLRDWFLNAEGGTGFLADSSGTKRTHIQKLQGLLAIPQYANPHMLVIQASVNDASYTNAQKTAAMVECLTFAADNWPGTPVIALGPTAANTVLSQTQSVDTDNALAAAVAAIGNPLVIHVPTMIGGLGQGITGNGNGNLTNPNGTGNADFHFKPADATHFAGEGHQRWAELRVAPQIASRLRALLNSLI